jgi:hypothetical protein
MEVALSGVHADMYPIVAPLELRAGIALFSSSLYTLQYRILDERARECFNCGACGDPHGYGHWEGFRS